MSDEESPRRKGLDVAIVVAIIGLVGTIVAAAIGNSDKLFGSRPTAPADQTTIAIPNSYPSNMGPLELRTDRHGEDFSPNPEHTEGPEACARLCGSTPTCKAMTYVLSPNGLPAGDCWLKKTVPPPSPRSDMTSAVKTG